MAYRFPGSDHFPPAQYRYRPTVPRNHQETRAVLYPPEIAHQSAWADRYPGFGAGSYPARYHSTPLAGHYPVFPGPFETVRERSYPLTGPYQSLPEGNYQSTSVEPYHSLFEQVPYQLRLPGPGRQLFGSRSAQSLSAPQLPVQRVSEPSHQSLTDLLEADNYSFTDGGCSSDDILASPNARQPPSPHSLVHCSIQSPSAPQVQAEKVSDSSHQSLDDILQSDNLNTFIDGSFDTGDIVIGDSEAQQPGVNFEELDLPLTGGDRADTTLTLVENPPNPVPGQWGEYGDLKGFLDELSKTMNRKLDKMGNAWADFAYDVTLKGQADDEWKDTIEQRIDDQQLTNMEMRIIDQMAEMERSHQKSQEKMQKMQEKIDLLLERRSMDEDSDY